MVKIFDYIFYRVCAFYRSKKDLSPEASGWVLNSVLQSLTFLDILIIARIIYEFPIPESFNKFWTVPIIGILLFINWYRYEKKVTYNELRKIWNDEEKRTKRKRGWAIISYICVSILIPILYGLIKQNIIGGKSFIG